jgi:hypothetical protein
MDIGRAIEQRGRQWARGYGADAAGEGEEGVEDSREVRIVVYRQKRDGSGSRVEA